MARDSLLLIDEMVLPNKDIPWRATQVDILMGCMVAARERTEEEWRLLFKGTGFKIADILSYREENQDCVIVATLE